MEFDMRWLVIFAESCLVAVGIVFFFFSSRRRHTRFDCDWSSDVCSSDLPWPTRGLQRIGGVDASVKVARGFSVILWRSGELGYALVSDLGSRELVELASKF